MDEGWDQDGYVVLAGAADAGRIAAYDAELEAARDRLLVRAPGDEYPSLAVRNTAPVAGPIDPYAICSAARDVLLAPATVATLTEALGAAPMLIDAAETTAGAPDPGPYRDPTYVAVSDPTALAGAVVALEPTAVTVYLGSHRLEPGLFSGRYRHFNPERDGEGALADHRARLTEQLAGADAEPRRVELAPGDVLLWRGDLVHTAPEGRALVAHLVPEHAEPGWFTYRPQRARRAPAGDAWIASQHYDLDGGEAFEPRPGPSLEAVGEALQAHDAVQAQDPAQPQAGPAGAAPRRGGLVSSVRGLMGRRGQR